MSRLGIITGISREAQCLAGAPADPSSHREIPLFRSAFGPDAAARAAQGLVEQGVGGLASAGIAGGLDPLLRAGDLLLPREVVGPERIYPVDPLWRDGLAGRLGGKIEQGRLLGVDVTIAGVAEKARARQAARCPGGRYGKPCGRPRRGRGESAVSGGSGDRRSGRADDTARGAAGNWPGREPPAGSGDWCVYASTVESSGACDSSPTNVRRCAAYAASLCALRFSVSASARAFSTCDSKT